ncbi:MAG TPA: hypothetical protein VLG76_01885 [Rhabdochlamydiaceae bacterium]|nr:hypothetical protein [Rhabdochlamydiaceae bacterium]
MKKICKCLLFILCFFAIERFCRLQTNGFSVNKIYSDHPFEEKWEVNNSEQVDKLLSEPFYFIGSGVQYYAFVSADQKTVLKIVKPYHLCPNFILSKLPFPKAIKERKKRLDAIFQSAKIAYEELKEETGLIFLHLNRTHDKYPKVKLYDKLGICHEVSLDESAFALQKKAKSFFSEPLLKQTIDRTFSLIQKRCKKGISNSDAVLSKNFGFVEDHAIEIDIGSFTKNPFISKPYATKRELLLETFELKQQLKDDPELLKYYYEKIFD